MGNGKYAARKLQRDRQNHRWSDSQYARRARGLGIAHGVDLMSLVATSVWLAGELGRPSPSRVVTALAPRLVR